MTKTKLNFGNELELVDIYFNSTSDLKSKKVTEIDTDIAIPISGHGACKSCGCNGYRPSKATSYCKCEHHFYQHEGSNW